MRNITELIREHSPPRPRRHPPAVCFYCAVDVEPDDIHVDGATGELALHRRRCAEALGVGLIRAADSHRRPGRPDLMAVA